MDNGEPRRAVYLTLLELLERIDEPNGTSCRRLLAAHWKRIATAAGATHNHQTWVGGYVDHLQEVMNLAVTMHGTLDRRRRLPFSESDALLVLFLHDLEKPWRQQPSRDQFGADDGELDDREAQHRFRRGLADDSGITLSSEHLNALRYVEGENESWAPDRRTMVPLAAFCHCCDTLSARLWFDRPLDRDETWGWRSRRPGHEPSAT